MLITDLSEPQYLPPLITNVGTRVKAVLHRTSVGLLLELEPFSYSGDSDVPQLFRRLLSAVHLALILLAACDAVVRHLRVISGFDRVIIYQFNNIGDGLIIAEDRRADLSPFIGLHYPATDIHVQARRLFVLNPLRIWSDTTGKPSHCCFRPRPHLPSRSI